MKFVFIFILGAFSLTALAAEKANYPTETARFSHSAGLPWADGNWSLTEQNVIGSCEDYGKTDSEQSCQKRAEAGGYRYYQTTRGNILQQQHGRLWSKTFDDYIKCFGCR